MQDNLRESLRIYVRDNPRDTDCLPEKRFDYDIVAGLIKKGAKILDLGCGCGDLLKLLKEKRSTKGFGVEIDESKVISCVSKGLTVHHGDLETVINEYPDNSFDYVILSLTLQAVGNPSIVIDQMLRIGKKVVVSFPNFAFLPLRAQLALLGRMPKTSSLPFEWYDTPNIHLTTIKDFVEYCKARGIGIEKAFYVGSRRLLTLLPNLRASEAIFVLRQSTVNMTLR